MNRDASLAVVAGLILVTVVIVAAAAVFGTTRTTSSSGPSQEFPSPPADGSFGIVFGLHINDSLSILGLKLRTGTYLAQIAMTVPSQCIRQDEAGQEELLSDGNCADLPAHGELAGGGTSITGERLAIVQVEVSKACYTALATGDRWPSSEPGCE